MGPRSAAQAFPMAEAASKPSLPLLVLLVLQAASWAPGAVAFYLPGLAPVNYCKEDATTAQCQSNVSLYVNRLTSDESVLPYEYHQSPGRCVGPLGSGFQKWSLLATEYAVYGR
ncbi:hypothetical protein HPB49_020258 [Dermacentor silvarum]|uniref:Uncharacterized protein n=1 Tax=Dermacentor silvarum TaxID=543639 RepID=A0ACB8DFK8_DERSI|nr:hypothetical protein HPB49_020258 [Dermacentor silvarum]